MSYQYPEHFKYPEGERYFFLNHVDAWKHFLPNYGDEPRVCLEIGALYGGSSVYIMENFCKMNGSHHYIMDINTNEFIENNIKPYEDKVTYILGESSDSFKTLNHNGETKEFLDFVYIDGNHKFDYVLRDCGNAWKFLNEGGFLVCDDYIWNYYTDIKLNPCFAVNKFLEKNKVKILLVTNSQIFFQKIKS